MTSLVGKLKWLFVIIVLGNYAFAKAETRPFYCNTTAVITGISTTFTIDKSTEREELFRIMSDLKALHNIDAKLTAYKRNADVITSLGMQFISASGVVTNMQQDNTDGITAMCIIVNNTTKEIERARTCEQLQVKDSSAVNEGDSATTLREAKEERIEALRERIATSQEAAALRVEQQREENRLALEQRKLEMAEKIAASRKRTDSIAQQSMIAREEQRLELQRKTDLRKQELEQARLDALEAEKKAIIEQTIILAAKAKEEQQRLNELREEKERVAQAGIKQEEALVASRIAAQFKKDSLLEVSRGAKRQRLTIERVQLEKAQANRDRIIAQRNQLEEQRVAQEQILKKLELAQKNTSEIIALRKEQNALKLKIKQLELERQHADAVLVAPLVNEDFLYEGFLYFNMDQRYYKVVTGMTYVFDNLGGLLFVLDGELEKGTSTGTLTIKENPFSYELSNDVLTIKNGYGQPVNQYGEPLQKSPAATSDLNTSRQPFNVSEEFTITATTTQKDIDELALAIENLGHQFQLYDFERTTAGGLSKIVFYIDENNYTFHLPDGIPSIVIQYDDKQNAIRVKAQS